ncbi:MAG: tryptophan synthase subunit alpha [Burkholderiaceae bacterium]|nr:MAG: tryptophan synthase subunit alpha [Burkholderiaceae bacterium]
MSNLKSTNRIAAAFAAAAPRTALIPYIAAGDPSVRVTPLLMQALADAGADIIELGVPFSDPMADGPVIQRAAQRAIERGVSLTHVLQMVAQFRRGNDHTPVVLMGYANPIERMGQAAFAKNASAAGVDGVLVVDYPPEEMVEFAALLDKAGIAPIFLLAPTSVDERIRLVARVARGYVYYVSLRGVTGAGNLDVASVKEKLDQIRRHVSLPVGVGFGIRDAQTAQSLAGFSDAVVIGSKLIETMEGAVAGAAEGEADAVAIKAASTWLRGIRQALEEAVRR